MKKTILSALLASALALGFAASASAGTVTGTSNITLNVPAMCSMMPTPDLTVNMVPGQTYANSSQPMAITCNNLLPYTIEVDNAVGGAFTLNGPSGQTVGATLRVNDGLNPIQAFGVGAEAYHGTGTGSQQMLTLLFDFNAGGISPTVGSYTHVMTTTATF